MPKRSLSPRLSIPITPEAWTKAKRANSAACLIADAARTTYPHLTGWVVDMAQIAATDPERGVRYHWITPQPAQDLLLAFDQGWAQPASHKITLARAFRVTAIRRSTQWRTPEDRVARLAELEAKEADGSITSSERGSLTRMRRNPGPDRPSSGGPTTVTAGGTAVGGHPPKRGKGNPNLLAGLNRAYGAKRARPAQAFRDAVEQEVEARLRALSETQRPEQA